MRVGAATSPPSGFAAFCKRTPGECTSRTVALVEDPIGFLATDQRFTSAIAADAKLISAELKPAVDVRPAPRRNDQRMALTGARWAELQEISREINAAIRPVTDQEAFGRQEYWTMPLTLEGLSVGDCEDFALEKRRALMERGWPEGSLLLAAAIAPGYGRHAILVVATDRGDYVLDNLSDEVKPWAATGYYWQTRQDQHDPLRWVTISNLRARGEPRH